MKEKLNRIDRQFKSIWVAQQNFFKVCEWGVKRICELEDRVSKLEMQNDNKVSVERNKVSRKK